MSPRDIEELCRGIVPGNGEVAVQPLSAGLLTETYRVGRQSAFYALKVAAEHRPALRVELSWQVKLLERAAAAGLAATLVYCDLKGEVLLAQWVPGRPWSLREGKDPANLGRIAALLRRVHGLDIPSPTRTISPAQWIEMYTVALSKRALSAVDPQLAAAAAARASELERFAPSPRVICHSDLHALNLIEQNDALILLDWEYAHVADPLWDLAGWSGNNDLEPELQWRLLTEYAGTKPVAGDWQRLRLLLWLYDYVCLLWNRLDSTVRGTPGSEAVERARLLDARLRLAAHYAA
jgi:aminoglycoside phosphotransferase (APT) family kinase protein